VDARGIPLSIVVSGANRHDVRLLVPTLARVVVARPRPGPAAPHHLCADKGYTGASAWAAMVQRRYIPHVPQRGEALSRQRHPGGRARRWVVERTHSWLNRFRKLLVRFEKLRASHEALLELACALIVFRQIIVIHG
jgi:putative transposase